jgi:hypothetical protein
VPIRLRPGIQSQPTPLLNEGGWSYSQNVRWKDGLPEKYGGYTQFSQVPTTSGQPLALRAWTSLADLSFLGIACYHGLEIFLAEVVSDITPLTISSLVPVSLSTVIGSAAVVVTDAIDTPSVGEWFQVHDAVSVGGIVLAGSYGIIAVGSGTYTITASTNATSTVTNGGESRLLTTVAGSKVVTVTLPNHGLFNGQVTTFGDATPIGGLVLQGNYLATYVGPNVYEVMASTAATSSVTEYEQQATFGAGNALQLSFFNPGGGTALTVALASPGVGNYSPGDTITLAGGTVIPGDQAVLTVTATQAVSATIDTPGTGGVPGPDVVTGTTGVGTLFELNVTIGADGGISSIDSVAVPGDYTVNPTTPAFEPVVDSAALTGAVVNVVIGALTAIITNAGNYTAPPPNPVGQQSSSGTGTGATWTLTFSSSVGTQADIRATTASLANWGEFLMFCPQYGPVFLWMPATGVMTPSANIGTAPQSNGSIFVASQEEQLFCLGSVNAATGLFDPMLINWSDVADYTDFVPTVENQAGDFRLTVGSRIVGGLALASGNVIWTDLAVYWSQYLGTPLVWGFQPIALNFGLVGPHAFGTLGVNIFWMTQRQFIAMPIGGAPTVIPCAVWDLVFKNLDLANLTNVVCETNSFYDEVSWEVPQADGTTTRATLQIDSGLWSYTVLPDDGDDVPRVAWIDQSVFGAPLAADASGIIWQHETGNNAGTQPLAWSLTSGIIMIAEGDQITFFREVRPDFKFSETGPGPGVVQCKIYVYQDPLDSPTVKGPFYITDATRSIPGARGRGRGIQFEFSGNSLNEWVRGGLIRYRGNVDGRR